MPDTAAPSRIVLRLAGAFGVSDNLGAEIGILSRRSQALLAFLSQQRGMRAERGLLADLLWSDRSEEQARASLRQELSVLRKALPDGVLDASRQHVWLDPSRVTADRTGGGVFLEGFDLNSEGFEDWLREERMAGPPQDKVPDAPLSDAQFFARPTVLLFAFEALSAGAQDQMLADGLAEDLRTTLCYWRWFPVIGPDAIGWATARGSDVRATARDVGAAYAVTGSLRCAGGRVRIGVGLTEVATGRSVWSETFEGTLDDIFSFQEDVSRAIVAQLEPQLARAEAARIERLRPTSVSPWQTLAKADEIDRTGGEGYGTPDSNFEQVRLMEEVLADTPDFAPALARLGRIYFRAALLDWLADREATFAKALDCTERALRADPDNWEAHAYNGLSRIFGTREYEAGRFHGAESVRLNPSAALARHAAGCGLEWIGRPEEALEHLNQIFRLNPNFSGRAAALGDLATCEMFVGNRNRALDAARRLHAIAPDYARGLQRCVAIFGFFGETEAAARALAHLRRIQPDFGEDYVRATYPYARERDLETFVEGLRRAGAFPVSGTV